MQESKIQPINIVFIKSALNRGGSETVLIDLINNLDRERFNPILCVLYDGTLLEKLNNDILVYKKIGSWWGDIRILFELIKILRSHSPRIVDIFGRDIAGIYGRLAAMYLRINVIIQSLHYSEISWKANLKIQIQNILNRLCDHWTKGFVIVSNSMLGFYKKLGIPEDRMFNIPNGIDILRFSRPNIADFKLLNQLNISKDTPIIIQVANFREVKRHDVLINAMPIILRSFPDARCLLIGNGPLIQEVKDMAIELNLSDNVIFLGSQDSVEKFLKISNVFVLTSDSESFSLATVEAMCIGIPVVTTNTRGATEIVVDGKTGFLVPKGNPMAIAEKVLLLLNDAGLAHRMGMEGRRQVIENFSMEHMISSREKLYIELLT